MKRLIAFDLDGTLAESKAALDGEMAELILGLLAVVRVAIISGAGLPQFEEQVIAHLPPQADLRRLSLLPTCGTRFYAYSDRWEQLYAQDLSPEQKQTIVAELERAVAASGFAAKQTWGETIEDRGSQITYSALGQQAPLDAKKSWDPDFSKRRAIQVALERKATEFFPFAWAGPRRSTSRYPASIRPTASGNYATSSAFRSRR